MRRRQFVTAAMFAALPAPSVVRAQQWPTRQVKVVIPYPPGGPTDISTRIVLEKVGRLLGQQILDDSHERAKV